MIVNEGLEMLKEWEKYLGKENEICNQFNCRN